MVVPRDHVWVWQIDLEPIVSHELREFGDREAVEARDPLLHHLIVLETLMNKTIINTNEMTYLFLADPHGSHVLCVAPFWIMQVVVSILI